MKILLETQASSYKFGWCCFPHIEIRGVPSVPLLSAFSCPTLTPTPASNHCQVPPILPSHPLSLSLPLSTTLIPPCLLSDWATLAASLPGAGFPPPPVHTWTPLHGVLGSRLLRRTQRSRRWVWLTAGKGSLRWEPQTHDDKDISHREGVGQCQTWNQLKTRMG